MDEPTTMASFLTLVGSVVTQALTWIGNVATTIVDTPLFAFSLGFFALGAVIGLVGRMLSRS